MVYTKLPGTIPRCRVRTDGTTPGCLECVCSCTRREIFYPNSSESLVEHFLKGPTWVEIRTNTIWMRVIVCTLKNQATLNMDAELLREGGHV